MKISDVITRATAMRPTKMENTDMARLVENLDLRVREMVENVRPVTPPVMVYGTDPSPLGDEFGRASYLPRLEDNRDLFADLAAAVRLGLLTDEDKTLLLPQPYDEVYVLYLVAQIDYYNKETALYANDAAMYDMAMREAQAWWRRNHQPRAATNWVV